MDPRSLIRSSTLALLLLGVVWLANPAAAWHRRVPICHVKILDLPPWAAQRHIDRHGDWLFGEELCDGVDNDCNGMTDENLGGASCHTGDAGECSAGSETCTAGELVCVPQNAPSPELCDGLDNDCDGLVDEGDGGAGGVCAPLCPSDGAISFTGDAEADFAGLTGFQLFIVNDEAPFVSPDPLSLPVERDVDVPLSLCSGSSCPTSGWDLKRAFFAYDPSTDQLHVGLDCFETCGDAEGDGDPGSPSPALAGLGGEDPPDLASSESFALALDFDLDVADVLPSFVADIKVPWDAMVGVPSGQPAGLVDPLPCSVGLTEPDDLFNMARCLGVYEYQDTIEVGLSHRFLRELTQSSGVPWHVVNHNPVPSATRPDLEFTIMGMSDLRGRFGAPGGPGAAWTMLLQGFMGSLSDADIDEDYLPRQLDFIEVSFPECSLAP